MKGIFNTIMSCISYTLLVRLLVEGGIDEMV